jgi:serine/threonine protein kinase/tetratricopeptide (TPR) repeat protein
MDMTPAEWNRVKELFQTALDLDPSQRVAFLAENCHDDQIRTEVERLLRNYQEAASFFNDPALNPLWEDRTTEGSSDSRAASTLFTTPFETEEENPMTGRRLGAYKVVRCIGQGGMAAVFLATRADDEYQKQVAIKLVHQGLDSRELLSRFRKERQTLADLDHPNIVKLLDGGSTQEGAPFLVMDYVEGTPIDEFCDHHKLCVGDRLRLFSKVCEALQYAHRKSIVHRDLKPSNILVTNDGTPKVLDFGIAKVLSSTSAQTLTLTQTRTRCMTPAYASPEQMRGKSITTATDIYSLGVMVYELLSGHRPYRLKEHTAVELERAICEQEPALPSTSVGRVETDITSRGIPVTKTPELVSQTREGSPEKLRRRLRGDLDNIVLKALQKEPERRYSSVEEFSRDISRHLQHLPVRVRRRTLIYSASKFVWRHKAPLSAILFLLIVVAGAAAWTLYTFGIPERFLKGNSDPQIRSLAVLPLVNLSGDPAQEYFSDGMTDSLITNLAQIATAKVISRTSIMRFKKTDKTVPEIAKELNVDRIIEGTVQRSGDQVQINMQMIHGPTDRHVWAQSYKGNVSDLFAMERDVTEDIARQVQSRLSAPRQRSLTQPKPVDRKALELYLKGNSYVIEGERSMSDDEKRQAAEYFQQAIDIEPSFVPAYIGLANAHDNRRIGSSEDLALIRQAAEKVLALDPNSSDARCILANLKWSNFEWAAAEEESRRAVEANPNNANAHDQLGMVLAGIGRLDDALRELEIAQTLDPTGDHLPLGLEIRGEYDQARAIILQRAKNSPQDGVIHYGLYRNYLASGKPKESIEEMEKALVLWGMSDVAANMRQGYAASGYTGALRQLAKVLEQLQASHAAFVPENLAVIYAAVGEKDKAFYWLDQAYEHREKVSHDFGLTILKVDPLLAPLHSDPRFAQLLRRIGLPDMQLSEPKFRSKRNDDQRVVSPGP